MYCLHILKACKWFNFQSNLELFHSSGSKLIKKRNHSQFFPNLLGVQTCYISTDGISEIFDPLDFGCVSRYGSFVKTKSTFWLI